MANWYEVFDNEEVQRYTRKRVVNLISGVAAGALLTLAFIFYTYLAPVSPTMALMILCGIWLNVAAWVLHRFERLRRLMWCIKLSDRRIEGYDYARRKTVLDWTRVLRVELNRDGLIVVGDKDTSIEVSHLFPEFSILSHRIEEYAAFYGIPILIDGRTLDDVDIAPLLASPDAPLDPEPGE